MEFAPSLTGMVHSPIDTLNYKYLLVDRVGGCSTREFWTLQGNSLVFILDSPFSCFWDEVLVPWEHYVPIRSDLSDAREKVDFFRKFDYKALKIVRNMQLLFREVFDFEYQLWYLHSILLELGRLEVEDEADLTLNEEREFNQKPGEVEQKQGGENFYRSNDHMQRKEPGEKLENKSSVVDVEGTKSENKS